jgi:hypothetical protein
MRGMSPKRESKTNDITIATRMSTKMTIVTARFIKTAYAPKPAAASFWIKYQPPWF